MILQDSELISRLIDPDPARRIAITPLLDPRKQIGASSIDVRLGTSFLLPETSSIPAIDPKEKTIVERYMRRVIVDHNEPFFIHPGEFVLASTLEFIRVPRDLACRIEGRSSWGRLGLLVHATAGFIDPGYAGTITYELLNAGKLPIRLMPGMAMAQLCFVRLEGLPWIAYDQKATSKYSQSLGVGRSRSYRD
jgi:dCTP deaminase